MMKAVILCRVRGGPEDGRAIFVSGSRYSEGCAIAIKYRNGFYVSRLVAGHATKGPMCLFWTYELPPGAVLGEDAERLWEEDTSHGY